MRVRDTSRIVTSTRISARGLSAVSMMFLIRPIIGALARTLIALSDLCCVTIGRLPAVDALSIWLRIWDTSPTSACDR